MEGLRLSTVCMHCVQVFSQTRLQIVMPLGPWAAGGYNRIRTASATHYTQ